MASSILYETKRRNERIAKVVHDLVVHYYRRYIDLDPLHYFVLHVSPAQTLPERPRGSGADGTAKTGLRVG